MSIARIRPSLAVCVGLAAGMIGGAAQAQALQVTATDAWSRATPPGVPIGAVYVTLTSPGGDKLVAVSSPASAGAGVHEMTMTGTIMRMREVAGGLDLPAGKPVVLAPGGYHIMLTDLKAPLRQGQTVSVHLIFARSAPVDVTAPIAGPGAAGPAGAGPGGGMAGMKMP